MKSMISESLAPCRIFSLTWFLRSSASGAVESAMVWFWQTRQRSSAASAMTFCSSAGSAAAGAASFACAHGAGETTNRNARSLATAELLHQGQHLVPDDLRGERADALVADHAALVDHVGLGHAVDSIVDADLAFDVVDRELIGIAHAFQPRQAVFALVLVVQPVKRDRTALREVEQHRMLLAAGDAPGGPDIEHPDAADHVLFREGLRRLVELRQFEMGRGLADQRRGNLARIEREPDREQCDQRREYGQGQNEAIHRCLFGIVRERRAPPRTAPAIASPRPGSAGRSRRSRRPAP